jgi:cytochrome P450
MSNSVSDTPALPLARAESCPFNPPPGLSELRAAGPIAQVRIWTGDNVWLVTRHEDQRKVLADPRVSVDTTRPGYPFPVPARKVLNNSRARLIQSLDPPDHTVLRRMLAPEFTLRQMRGLHPFVQQIVDQLIDDMIAGPRPTDLVQAFSLPIPSVVIAQMLGVPYTDHEMFQDLSEKITTKPELSKQAARELNSYLGGLAETKRQHPSDDIISRLMAHCERGDLSIEEVVGAAKVLLVGGHETTAHMISLGVAALLQHPDQLAELRDADDPAFVANAVEELLRYLHVGNMGLRRVATEDLELAGQTIRSGDGIVVAGNLGDRDPSAFEGDPDVLDIHRRARHHIAFGFGIHQCLGQALVRLELQVVFPTLFRRLPTLALATPFDQIAFKPESYIFGVQSLPVTW